jgi:putative nucleotidyltransferase with HDIG domain
VTLQELRKLLASAISGSEFASVSYFAGGCVRDHLLAKRGFEMPEHVEEADISVEMANGGEALAQYLYRKLGTSEPVVYRTFGTASLVYEAIRLEFVMTRSESYRPSSRKPSVKPATLSEDAARRDFGINALYMNITTGEVLDPTGKGFTDIERCVVCCVDAPETVFAEDPLRLMRAIRFSARFGFPIGDRTFQGIVSAADSIRTISEERIADEFNRMLCITDAHKAVAGVSIILESGILRHILPELAVLHGLKQNRYHHLDAFEHTLEVLRNTHNGLCLRWAALLHDIGKAVTISTGSDGRTHFYGHERVGAEMADAVLRRFGIAAGQRYSITHAIAGHMLFKQAGPDGQRLKDATLRRYQHRFGKDLELLLDLAHADNLAHHPDVVQHNQIAGIRSRLDSLRKDGKRFSLTGKDIMRDFDISEGIVIGEMLDFARDTWFECPDLGKRELLDRVSRKFGRKKERN